MSFSQHGPRAVCILSANGATSNVTIRQAATSGGTVTNEIVVGSCNADRKESKSMKQVEPSSAPPKLAPGSGATGAGGQPSWGTPSESSGGTGSPLNQSNPQTMINMTWK
ncbi:hypothetical protein HHK36_010505 [Tetracentron sinense]|uniref:AT-hook motif nuclear-localized protein n=1 Tax=Tetracentron sinense TaxID=13715 RepID=A0A835DJ73_TETSI|nr:hypothetical protein HHK36_010505 [Tetracentron sinense]